MSINQKGKFAAFKVTDPGTSVQEVLLSVPNNWTGLWWISKRWEYLGFLPSLLLGTYILFFRLSS